MRRKRASSDATPALYVRIDKAIRDKFGDWVEEETGLSEKQVVENLIKWFLGLSPGEQQQVIAGHSVIGVGELIEQLAWADHAFDRRFWDRARQEFEVLEKKAIAINASGFVRIAQYKQAFCWLDIAIGLRNEAFEKSDTDRLAMARKALVKSTLINKRKQNQLIADEGPKQRQLIIAYNLACAFSLMAQFKAEFVLFDTINSMMVDNNEETIKNAWKDIGGQWRKLIEEKIDVDEAKVVISDTERYALESLHYLNQLMGDREVFAYVVNVIRNDRDFDFLRHDIQYGSQFERILSASVSSRESLLQDLSESQDLDPDNPEILSAIGLNS